MEVEEEEEEKEEKEKLRIYVEFLLDATDFTIFLLLEYL